MARILIIGCGCRGQALARELREAGHTVRGTTRDPGHQNDIEAAGAESILADPDRIGTLIPALAGVTIMCHLLACATGTQDHLEALHTTRLEALLQRTIDTTIHGVLYEAQGTIPEALLATGADLVKSKCNESRIHYAPLKAEPSAWLATALKAVEALLAPE